MFPLTNHDYSEGEQGSVVMKFTQIVVSIQGGSQDGKKLLPSFHQSFQKSSWEDQIYQFSEGKTMENPALDRDQMRSVLWHNL